MSDKNTNVRDLAYFRELQYDVVVKKRKDRFIVIIPELAIAEEDESLDKAYEKLDLEKERYLQKMIENEYQGYIKEPEGRRDKKRIVSGMAPFFVKVVVVLIVVALGARIVVGTFGASAVELLNTARESTFWAAKISDVIYYMKYSPSELLNDRPAYKTEIMRLRNAAASRDVKSAVVNAGKKEESSAMTVKEVLVRRPVDFGAYYEVD